MTDISEISSALLGSEFIIPLALLVGYLFVALSYMLSKLLSSRQLEEWSKNELRESLLSTVFAVGALSFVMVMVSFVDTLFGETSTEGYLAISAHLMRYMIFLLSLSSNLVFILMRGLMPYPTTDAHFIVSGTEMGYNYNILASHNLFIFLVNNSFPLLILSLTSILSQYYLFLFLQNSYPYFVALGLFFRALPFTRKIGGTLIALGVGSYSFMYLAMGLEGYAAANTLGGLSDEFETVGSVEAILEESIALSQLFSSSPDTTGFISLLNPVNAFRVIYSYMVDLVGCEDWIIPALCRAAVFAFVTLLFLPLWSLFLGLAVLYIILQVLGVVASAITFLGTLLIFGTYGLGRDFALTMYDSIEAVGPALVVAFLFPVLNVIIMLAGIRSLITLFGGDERIVSMLEFL